MESILPDFVTHLTKVDPYFLLQLKMSRSIWLPALASYVYAATVTYNWNVTWVSVSPDGFRRPAIGINGTLNSPSELPFKSK